MVIQSAPPPLLFRNLLGMRAPCALLALYSQLIDWICDNFGNVMKNQGIDWKLLQQLSHEHISELLRRVSVFWWCFFGRELWFGCVEISKKSLRVITHVLYQCFRFVMGDCVCMFRFHLCFLILLFCMRGAPEFVIIKGPLNSFSGGGPNRFDTEWCTCWYQRDLSWSRPGVPFPKIADTSSFDDDADACQKTINTYCCKVQGESDPPGQDPRVKRQGRHDALTPLGGTYGEVGCRHLDWGA